MKDICSWKETPQGIVCEKCNRPSAVKTDTLVTQRIRHCLIQSPPPPLPPYDTGDQLHTLVKQLTGQDVSPTCTCRRMIQEMNQRGPNWSREHLEQIVGVMLQEADRRGLAIRLGARLAGPAAARWMVRRAIRESERNSKKPDGLV